MSYVDVQRREELARNSQDSAGPWHAIKKNPYLSLAAAPAAYWLTGWMLVHTWDTITFAGSFAQYAISLIVALAFVLRGAWQFRQRGTRGVTPEHGGEKQLLVALQDAGGSITPVEAALETSLTVDEAEEILTRLADRGHLPAEAEADHAGLRGAIRAGAQAAQVRHRGAHVAECLLARHSLHKL